MTTIESLVADVAIIGAGLCGLALARALCAQDVSVVVIEARERVGGRVLTQRCEATGQMLDLGPAWFWPDVEPRIAALLDELDLPSAPQYHPGDVLWLTDPNREPERREEPLGLHAGARRVAGGTARLVDALAAALPAGCVRTGSAVRLLRDCGASLELQIESSDGTRALRARRAIFALPPRLVQERVRFDPPLPAMLADSLAATPTWMAAQAKALTTYAQPFWRDAGHSGNAFVSHAQAMLGEVFDASDETTGAGALGGFVALDAAQRLRFQRGMPLLIESQLVQLYGARAQESLGRYLLDWADEPWTCSSADREGPPVLWQADPALRRAYWGGRLYFGGSETAAHGVGHMEGALEAAARVERALAPPALPSAVFGNGTHVPDTADGALACFAVAVSAHRARAPSYYRQNVTRLLAAQQSQQLTQHALLATVELVYSATLALLDGLIPALGAAHAGPSVAGRHALTPTLLAPFEGWNRELLSAALAFNNTSCALSNFPAEHQPDAALQRAIALDLVAAWREFALEVNARLVHACPDVDPAAVPA
jgi:monoamine oxidase